MSALTRLSAACSTLLVASALVVAPFLTGPAIAAELIQDGGFEAATGSPPNSPSWTETDSRWGGSPLCNTSACGDVNGTSVPRTGIAWARFGGGSGSNHTASIAQTMVIPAGTASLTYWYRNSQVSGDGVNGTLQVRVDGTTVRTHTESSNAQGSYSLQTVNVSQFANGGSHTLSFVYANASGTNRMIVDDVSLNHTPPTVTETPIVTSTSPASPNPDITPQVRGTAESGSTVTLYSDGTCTSAISNQGSAATFAGAGITATVLANTTTTIFARATKSGQTASACSSTSVSYTHDSIAPELVTLTSITPDSPGSSLSPVVRGTAEAGSTVRLYPTGSCTGSPAATGTAEEFGSTGLTVTVSEGSTTTFKATAEDAAGNTSGCSTSSLTYVNDSTAPPPVTLTSVTPDSPDASTTPVVRGTAEAGSTVELYTTAGCTGSPVATGTAAAFAGPGLTVTVAADSTNTFRATATDVAGNTSACSTSSLTYVNDSTAPPLVTLTSVDPASPSGSTTPVVRGDAEAGSTVRMYTTADCTGSPAATGTASAFASTGFTVTVAMGSTTTFRATATDAAGNTSACSTSSLTYVNNAAELLQDGGFEAATGNPANSPFWTEADSLAGSPLCTLSPVETCTPGGGLTAPRTGNAWAWFGGFADSGHVGSVTQAVIIPVGPATLTYWFRNSTVSSPFDAQLLVQVDGVTVRTHTEATVAEGAYSKQTVDLAAFADGASHTLAFSYANGGTGVNNMVLDDVSIITAPAPETDMPTVTGTTPGSPSTSTTPKVTGIAVAGSTVTLYSNSTCTSGPLGTGLAADFETAGITATVPVNATTTIFARARLAGLNASPCSTTSVSYTQLGPPDTTLTKKPKKKVFTRKRKAKVVFAFASPVAGVTFECSIDGKAYKACTSGAKLKLKLGKHTFAVRAVRSGQPDPTPATYRFKVKPRT